MGCSWASLFYPLCPRGSKTAPKTAPKLAQEAPKGAKTVPEKCKCRVFFGVRALTLFGNSFRRCSWTPGDALAMRCEHLESRDSKWHHKTRMELAFSASESDCVLKWCFGLPRAGFWRVWGLIYEGFGWLPAPLGSFGLKALQRFAPPAKAQWNFLFWAPNCSKFAFF